MNLHELKDIVMVYSTDSNGKPSYEWDKAKIVAWNPLEQREMDLVFVGSNKGESPEEYKIHFNVNYKDQGFLMDVFTDTLKTLFPNIDEDTTKEYMKIFLNKLSDRKK